mgnify:FL=1
MPRDGKAASAGRSAGQPAADGYSRLTALALVLGLAVMAARAMAMEFLRDPLDVVPGMMDGPRGPGPAATLAMNLLCAAPALMVLARRLLDRSYVVRFAWSHGLLLALAAWGLLAVAWSTDRFAAMVSATTLASAAALLWATAQLVRSWLRLRLAAGMALGLLLVYVACGLVYHYLDAPQMRKVWQTDRSRILRERGWEEGSFHARQFEQKVMGGEVVCFAASANTYAAAMVLMAAVAMGLIAQRVADRDAVLSWLPVVLALGAAGLAIYLTKSRAAYVTPVLAAALLVKLRYARSWMARNARLAYGLCAVAILLGAAAVVGHALHHGGFPDRSLTFRWYYWTGAARIFLDHALRGVGLDNFALFYPSERLAVATEEVRDPHNLLVRFFVELGLVGGALAVAWIARMWWELTAPISPRTPPPGAGGSRWPTAGWIAGVPALACLINALLAIDFAQADGKFFADVLSMLGGGDAGSGNAHVLLEIMRRVGWWFLLMIGMALAGVQGLGRAHLDQRPAPWVLYGVLAGLGLFLVHNLIDFSFFEAGPMCLFALLAGAALGVRHPSLAGRTRRQALVWAGASVALLAWLTTAGNAWLPTLKAELANRRGDRCLATGQFQSAVAQYMLAWQHQPLNADYAYRAARAMAYAGTDPAGMLDAAIRANRRHVGYHLMAARNELQRPQPNPRLIEQYFRKALELDPAGVEARLTYAEALEKLGDKKQAAQQYRLALEYDHRLPEKEPKRLPADRRQEILRRLDALSQ